MSNVLVDDPLTQPPEPPRGAMTAIFLIVLSDLFGFGLIIPALPFYARAYHASDLQVGFIFALFSLFQLIATPLLGLASDRFGRRPILLGSQIGSVVGYLVLALAMSRHWSPLVGLGLIYLSRVIDGISGGNISTAQAYVSDVTTPENRAKGMGMLGAAFGIGFALGPALGGIAGHFHPSLPALLAVLASGTAAVMTYLRLKEPARHRSSEQIQVWLHPSRFRPILNNPVLLQMLLISFFTMMAFVMMESVFAIFAADTYGFGQLGVGLFFMFAGLVIIVVQGKMVGIWTRRFGEWRLVIAGPAIVALAMSLYVLIVVFHMPLSLGVTIMLVAGLLNATGRSVQTPTLSSLISQTANPSMQGTVFGLFHMLGALGRVIGPVLATALYTKHHTAPFLMAAIITLAMASWSIVLRHRHGRTGVQPVATGG